MNLCLSPTSAACATSRLIFSLFSIGWGATILPPEVFSNSFLRSVMKRNPSASNVADVAGAEPSLRVETLGIGFGLLPVAGKDRRAADQQLSIRGQLSVPDWARACPRRPCGGAAGVLRAITGEVSVRP